MNPTLDDWLTSLGLTLLVTGLIFMPDFLSLNG